MPVKCLIETPEVFTRRVLDPIQAVVGSRGIITNAEEIQPFMLPWRDSWVGHSPLVVQPATTEELAEVVRICSETRTPIVPQGGNTGLTGAAQPHSDNSEIVISTTRMNRIREIDIENDTMTVEAGCVLANIQSAAREHDRLFPLSFAAEGSCQIGGNVATNCGGVHVVRYGNMRNLVAGLEVVLPDGQIWNGLRGLRKDNAGYDMKQIFIGSEGTLGIITAAVLKLSPLPRTTATAFVAVPSPRHAIRLLTRAKNAAGDRIAAFELIQRLCVEIAQKHVPAARDPLAEKHDWYVLIELADQDAGEAIRELLEELLEAGMDAGEILDGVVAASKSEAEALWQVRENVTEGLRHEGASFKHDISVPISKIDVFLERTDAALAQAFPGIRPFSFGHLGDGNVHYNPLQPEGADKQEWARKTPAVTRMVHDIIMQLNGSISAEHGIGQLRLEEMPRCKSAVELEMMVTLKKAFDPFNIMNPGKVLPTDLL